MVASKVARSDNGLERRFAIAGLVGPPLFVIGFVVLGLIKPGYDPTTQVGSEGSLGQLGWVQITDFLVFGAMMLIFASGLWLGFGDRLSGRIGSVLIAMVGVGSLAAGAFVTDPVHASVVTSHGIAHRIASTGAFLSFAGAGFFFAKRFWSRRTFAIYSIVTGALVPVGILLIGPSTNRGLVQRGLLIVLCTWATILALRLRQQSGAVTGQL